LGCYGNDWIHTENLDSLAENSVVLDKAYVASFATIPHRTDLFTGKYTFLRSDFRPLPTNEIVIAQLLKQSGYVTMLIVDTYHMVENYFYRDFDGWWWIRGQENDRFMTNPTKKSKELGDILGHQYMRNVQTRRYESDYFVSQTMKSAVKWLELNYDKHENFFLHIDTFDPHEPLDPPKWYLDLYDSEWKGGEVRGGAYISDYDDNSKSFQRLEKNLTKNELIQLKAYYAGEVTLLDRWVGTLLEKIEDMGLYENTAVIFTADHGTFLDEHGYIGKRGHLYEENCHIPFIIRMPDSENIKPKRCEALVQPSDIMSTILDLANQKIPKIVEGESLLHLITGEDEGNREVAVSSGSLIPETGVYNSARRLTVSSKEWSLIAAISKLSETDELGRKTKSELYNLKNDPNQTINLYGEENKVVKQLHSKMIRFLQSKNTNEEILKIWDSSRFTE
jgi:arylsulfatase A-like enzyme